METKNITLLPHKIYDLNKENTDNLRCREYINYGYIKKRDIGKWLNNEVISVKMGMLKPSNDSYKNMSIVKAACVRIEEQDTTALFEDDDELIPIYVFISDETDNEWRGYLMSKGYENARKGKSREGVKIDKEHLFAEYGRHFNITTKELLTLEEKERKEQEAAAKARAEAIEKQRREKEKAAKEKEEKERQDKENFIKDFEEKNYPLKYENISPKLIKLANDYKLESTNYGTTFYFKTDDVEIEWDTDILVGCIGGYFVAVCFSWITGFLFYGVLLSLFTIIFILLVLSARSKHLDTKIHIIYFEKGHLIEREITQSEYMASQFLQERYPYLDIRLKYYPESINFIDF